MSLSTGLFIVGLVSTILAYFANIQDGKQKDRIEDLGKINKQLSTQIEKLTKINNEIASKTSLLVEENNELSRTNINLTDTANLLIQEVKKLTAKSNEIIGIVNTRTENTAAENALTGKLELEFRPLSDNELVSIGFGTIYASHYVKNLRNKAFKPNLFQFGNYTPITFNLIDDVLYVSVIVYDVFGNWIAEVNNNYWRRNPNYTGKFNYDKHGFEIIDNRNRIAFSIDLLSNNTIRIQGIIPVIEDNLIVFGGRSVLNIPANTIKNFADIDKNIKATEISPLFVYATPGWLHKRK